MARLRMRMAHRGGKTGRTGRSGHEGVVDRYGPHLYGSGMNHSDAKGCEGRGVLLALLSASRLLADRLEAALADAGLSTARYGVLEQLARAGDPLPLGELAARLSCVRSNVTQLVDRLEAEGLVRRVTDPADRRSVRAELTAAGRARYRQGGERYRTVESAFESRITDDDRAMLGRVLASLHEESDG